METRLRSILGLAGLICLFALPFGCKSAPVAPTGGTTPGGPNSGSGDTIKIGEYGSMTGSESAFGKSTDEGVELAIEEINKAGGVDGKKLEKTKVEDTESLQAKGEVACKRLVEQNVVAIIGEVASGISMAGAPVCQKAQIPMISPSSTNPKVTEIGDYIFRVCFIDPFQGAVIAKFASATLKAKTASILYDAGAPYSVGIRDEFTKAFTALGGKIVGETSYSKGDKDFKAPLTKLKSQNPDVIVAPGYYTEAGTICKQARGLGIAAPILGGDGWDNAEYHTYAGKDVANCFFSNHMSVDDPAPAIQAFVAAYKAKFDGRKPDALAALGYDSVKVLADAIKRAKSTKGPELKAALASTKDFDGVTGKITINAQRNADKGAVIMEVTKGEFKFKEAINKP